MLCKIFSPTKEEVTG